MDIELKNISTKYESYKDKKVSELAAGDITFLEKELQTLQSRLSSDLERLKGDQERYSAEISEKQEAVLSYNIPYEIYSEHKYNEENFKEILKQKEAKKAFLEKNKNQGIKIDKNIAVQKNNFEQSDKKLKARNVAPISKAKYYLILRRENKKLQRKVLYL